jgi:phosphoenolpyruvate carboxykinase (GTP)
MAMLPFCGYNMGDYFQHWLEIGPRLSNPPLIFHVNWFRKGAGGEFLWPGFGENMRALKWIIDRCEGRGGAEDTPIGSVPRPQDLDLEGLEGVSRDQLKALLAVNPGEWKKEIENQRAFFETLRPSVPQALVAAAERAAQRFAG